MEQKSQTQYYGSYNSKIDFLSEEKRDLSKSLINSESLCEVKQFGSKNLQNL